MPYLEKTSTQATINTNTTSTIQKPFAGKLTLKSCSVYTDKESRSCLFKAYLSGRTDSKKRIAVFRKIVSNAEEYPEHIEIDDVDWPDDYQLFIIYRTQEAADKVKYQIFYEVPT